MRKGTRNARENDVWQMADCCPRFFLDVPEVILYAILTYATPPTERTTALCQKIASLDSAHRRAVESGLDNFWSTLHTEEYGSLGLQPSLRSSSSGRRASKRLRRSSKDRVRESHRLLLQHTRVAHFALAKMAQSSRTSLSLARLRWLFREYGPVLRVNQRADIRRTILI